LLEHLDASTVLICEGQSDTIYGSNSESQKTDSAVRTLRVPLPNSQWRDLSSRFWSRLNLPVCFRTPDHLGSWKKSVLTRIERLITEEKYRPDVVVTFAFPLVDSIIGLELKRRYQLPWLAHFSDPWVDSPFQQYDRLTRALNVRLERSVIENADRLVFTSPETAELVMRKYPLGLSAKVRTVPHAFEAELFHAPSMRDSRFIIRYLGDLYLNRTPKPLFETLGTLFSSEPELLKRFCFEIVGDVHRLDLESMGISKLPEGLVIFRPRVSYDESLSLMASASGLMVIDAPVARGSKSVFLPSKLIEYVGAGRPVIGLTPQGTAADLIRKLGGWVANPADANELCGVMRQFLLFLSEHDKDQSAWGDPETRKGFEARNVVARFGEILTELSAVRR